jgi:hypothetical protein
MPRKKRSGGTPPKRPIEHYEHSDKKRINNPPVDLVTPETDVPTVSLHVHERIDLHTIIEAVSFSRFLNCLRRLCCLSFFGSFRYIRYN